MSDFETFARSRLPRLLRCAVMLTGERALAADLVQDVLVKAMRHWPRIQGVEDPDNYVLKMVTHQYLSWRRSWAVRHVSPVAELPETVDDHDAGGAYADRDDLWRRLAGLPRRQRAVLVLRYYEQLTDAEIAGVLGCSAVTVRGYAHRALATLRTDLQLITTRESS